MDLQKDNSLNRKIYVGNIPYTAGKEEIEKILSIVGPVINFEYLL